MIPIKLAKPLGALLALALAAAGGAYYFNGRTIEKLLVENEELRAGIERLTREEQIGYAKVLEQREENGRRLTKLKFVEVDPADKRRVVLEKTYTIEGDVVHFDLLIVRFDDALVRDGKARALYLWRRIYGEHQSPAYGYPIEEEGVVPARYRSLTERLNLGDEALFWESIWELAHDPGRLADHGVTAIYGNPVYTRLQPGLIYTFQINGSGQLTPLTVPDL